MACIKIPSTPENLTLSGAEQKIRDWYSSQRQKKAYLNNDFASDKLPVTTIMGRSVPVQIFKVNCASPMDFFPATEKK